MLILHGKTRAAVLVSVLKTMSNQDNAMAVALEVFLRVLDILFVQKTHFHVSRCPLKLLFFQTEALSQQVRTSGLLGIINQGLII